MSIFPFVYKEINKINPAGGYLGQRTKNGTRFEELSCPVRTILPEGIADCVLRSRQHGPSMTLKIESYLFKFVSV